MPKLSHMLNYSKTLPLQQPFSEMAKKKYQDNKNVLVKYSYFTGTQCLSLMALTLSTRRRYFSSIKGSVFSQVWPSLETVALVAWAFLTLAISK